MRSANKFIEFFVNDILDFSVLNQNNNNFTKIIGVFNIKAAIGEILDMFLDKIQLKNIKVSESYLGFEEDIYEVNTDQKRL